MKLAKSLLLGSAAGLMAVTAAQSADLPAKKVAPVEFVRVCSTYGAGFFYIPGTDTCLRISGRARAQYQYVSSRSYSNSQAPGDASGYRGEGWINLDARTATDLGTVRTFLRYVMFTASGASLNSGSNFRYGIGYSGTGIDTFGRNGTTAYVDKAFIQFAGVTAGRAASFFDFYAHDVEFHAGSSGSDVPSTNLLAYTATLGGGLTATISAEDPTFRRQPVYTYTGGTTTGVGPGTLAVNTVFFTAVPFAFDANGVPSAVGNLESIQRVRTPDVVGNLRLDQAWGSAQISAMVHEISIGKYSGVFATNGVNGTPTTTTAVTGAGNFIREPDAGYGFAIQGGVKVNLPEIAPGDVLWLQAAYSEGLLSATGVAWAYGRESNTISSSGRFVLNTNDAVVDAAGKLRLTQSASVTAAFLHYWTPQFRQAVFGSFAYVDYDSDLRTGAGPANLIFGTGTSAAAVSARNQFAFSPTLMDYTFATVGTNLIYSPVKDLDIGVEALYTRVDLDRRVNDANKNLGFNAAGIPLKTVDHDDVFFVRARVQRDF